MFSALTKFVGGDFTIDMDVSLNQNLGILMYVLLIAYLIWDSMRVKKPAR